MIESGDRAKFDAEMLKQLLKLLPEKHEVWPPSLAACFCRRRRSLCNVLPQQMAEGPVAFQLVDFVFGDCAIFLDLCGFPPAFQKRAHEVELEL